MRFLLESIGLAAVCTVLFYPLSYVPWVAEQHAAAVRANERAQCVGEARVAQRTAEQCEQL